MLISTPPIITIIGKSGTGKTTFLVKLIAELKQRGYKIGTIKHHSHRGFEIDKPGKDSWQHAQAGSDHVVIAAPDKIAAYRLIDQELELDEIARDMAGVDLILVEGYKRAGKPAIEVVRAEISTEMINEPEQCFAVVTDIPIQVEIPQFAFDDIHPIIKLIQEKFYNTHHEENR